MESHNGVEPPTDVFGGGQPLAWLNLLCLDAPLVAVSWACLFARSFGIPLHFGASAALFLTAWLIYLVDRFGDSSSLRPAAATSLRQRFCRRYRAAWLVGIIVVAVADGILIATQVAAHHRRWGAVLGVCAVVYLFVNQRLPRVWKILPLKEVSIGFLFAAGTMVPLVAGLTRSAAPLWLLFASLCALNCICIAAWERSLDLAQQRVSIATAFPKISSYLPAALALLGGLAVAMGASNAQPGRGYFCIAGSAFLLALVHACRRRIQQDARTALADLVLLTPVVVLLLESAS
jgi:hypothetical protein